MGFCNLCSIGWHSFIGNNNGGSKAKRIDNIATLFFEILIIYFCNLMKKWLYKILFLTISFSFFISATEMDLGECHNTFFDEYDTYVKTEQVSVDHAAILQQEHDTYVFLHNFFTCYNALNSKPESIKHQSTAYYNHYPPKLFLRNSVWRI